MKRILTIFLLLLGVCSCQDNTVDPNLFVDTNLASQLRSVETSLIIGDNHIILYGSPMRDFSLPARSEERLLECFARLEDVNGVAIPLDFTLVNLYVINGDQIWKSKFSDVRDRNSYELKYLMGSATGGPIWQPGSLVDVVVEFSAQGKSHRILDKARPIAAPQ